MIIRLFEHFTCRKRLYIVKFPIDLCCAKYFVMSRSWYICFLLGTIGMALSLGGCSSGDKEKSRRSVVVETITLVPSDNSYTDSFVGSVEESSAAALSFAVGGQVKRVLVTEGDRVNAGDELACLDATTLQHTYDAAKATLDRARDAYDRMKLLHDSSSLPDIKWVEIQSSLQQAESMERIAYKNLTDARLTAPFSGYIARRMIEVGDNVLPAATAFTLMEIATVDVKIAVPENEISSVSRGDSVEVCVGALDDRVYRGVVTVKGVSAHPLSHTYEVRARIDNTDGAMLPGMVCRANICRRTADKVFVLPLNAVFADTGKRHYVWIYRDGSAEKRYVTIGNLAAHGVIVTDGVARGERLIVAGCQKISEGMNVEER